jgi:predicted Zn-dependent protease
MRLMVQNNPDNPLVRFGYANELIKAEQWEDAERELAVYLEKYDDEGNGWLRYVDLLRRLGHDDKARIAIARGIDAAQRYGHRQLLMEFEERLDS